MLQHLTDNIETIEPSAWPDFVCILNRGLIGIGAGTNKPQFHLYGLLGRDPATENVAEIIVDGGPSRDEFIDPATGQRYPLMLMKGQYYVVDVARTFMGFLGHLYQMLLSKVITGQSNLLGYYLPKEMTRYVTCNPESQVKSTPVRPLQNTDETKGAAQS